MQLLTIFGPRFAGTYPTAVEVKTFSGYATAHFEDRTMKPSLFLLALLFSATFHAADLPTVTVEHLYYLQARAERVRKFKPDDMIEYCIAQKIGGPAFENLYSQLFTLRIDLARMLQVEEIQQKDPRVVTLNKTREAFATLLREEAQRVQSGLIREGQVATDTLTTIARAQNPQ